MSASPSVPNDAELVTLAIEASGLSLRRFAEYVLLRNERVVRRWRSGELSMPREARSLCEYLVSLTPKRMKLVRRWIDLRMHYDHRPPSHSGYTVRDL